MRDADARRLAAQARTLAEQAGGAEAGGPTSLELGGLAAQVLLPTLAGVGLLAWALTRDALRQADAVAYTLVLGGSTVGAMLCCGALARAVEALLLHPPDGLRRDVLRAALLCAPGAVGAGFLAHAANRWGAVGALPFERPGVAVAGGTTLVLFTAALSYRRRREAAAIRIVVRPRDPPVA